MILSRDDAKAILDRALSFAKADETEISIYGGAHGNMRFARNTPTTCGFEDSLNVSIVSAFGDKVGSFSTTETDDAALANAVSRAEEIARLSPSNPEYMPRLGAQKYMEVAASWDEPTARLMHDYRVRIASGSIDAAAKQDLLAAGYFEDSSGFNAVANSKGLFSYFSSTDATYTLTIRTKDDKGSGWAAQDSNAASAIDGSSITVRAIDKALRSHDPQTIDPGVYSVILEHSPAGDMLNLFSGSLDRRSADEGRSFFSNPKGGTTIGENLFGNGITIYSDPSNTEIPSVPWGEDGLPLERTMWVERGVQKNLACSRYWARQKNISPLSGGSNIVMEGGNYSLDDLVASMDYGLLVTSFWYIRQVDPQTMIYTGLTRDGVFLIEKGKITKPVNNMRWNESPAAIYKCVEMMTKPERVVTREGNMPMLAPALKVKSFTFTSGSTSI